MRVDARVVKGWKRDILLLQSMGTQSKGWFWVEFKAAKGQTTTEKGKEVTDVLV